MKMKKNLHYVVIVLLALVAAASLAVNGLLYHELNVIKDNPQYQAQEDTAQLLAKVSRLMVLPDEQPTIATVDDPSKLQGQAFFLHAIKGDKVLIFNTARQAILYSPSEDKIVDVAPIDDAPAPAAGPASTSAPAPSAAPPSASAPTAAPQATGTDVNAPR
jgi:hypothetical protein